MTDSLGRFGHHPDPAIDFEIEVECLLARKFDADHGQPDPTLWDDTAIAMAFRVGGDECAVRAMGQLRAMADTLPRERPDA